MGKSGHRVRFFCFRAESVYSDIPEEILLLVEPVVRSHALELVDAEWIRSRGSNTLRVIVDTPATDGRVSIERCAALSREVGVHLDASPLFGERYSLEVSSPGLNRRLAREKDFGVACGSTVQLETRKPLDGRRNFKGELCDFQNGELWLRVDGQDVRLPFSSIAKANVVYEFSSKDFARSKSSRS